MNTVSGPCAVGACLLCLSMLYALAATPLFSAADTPPSPQPHRLRTLDGVRGFLALGVFFHHAAIYHRYLIDGVWEPPPSRVFGALGPLAVEAFFMITAYLFWTRLLRDQGQPGWANLYVGRIFRIGPLFLVAFAGMALLALAHTHFHLLVPPLKLARQLAHAVGLGFFQTPEINLYPGTARLLDDVPWTLHYEWVFYLCLPLLAIAARRSRHPLALVLSACALTSALLVTYSHLPRLMSRFVSPTIWLIFLMGMITGSLLQSGLASRLSDRTTSVMVIALTTVTCFRGYPYSVTTILMVGVIFYLVASGCTVFGLLVSRPACRLGNISFGIYLLQGFAHAFVYRPHPLRAFTLSSFPAFWFMTLLAGILLLVAATLCHVWIERPGIALGNTLTHRFHLSRPPTQSGVPVLRPGQARPHETIVKCP